MYTPIPVPASLKEYKSFEFLQRDLRVTSAPSAGSLHGGQARGCCLCHTRAPSLHGCNFLTRQLPQMAYHCCMTIWG